jgi:hypothetical protein
MLNVNGLRGDMVLECDLRFDLAPIPATFEAKIRTTPLIAADYQEGKTITVNDMAFRIVKAEPISNAGSGAQGDYPLSGTSITAFISGCADVGKVQTRAVIRRNSGIASIYRALGGTAPFKGDINIPRFTCFKGDIPTFMLTQVLQEEAAALMWRNGAVHVMRLVDMFRQAPVEELTIENSEDVRSSFLEEDQIPIYISAQPDGSIAQGRRRSDRQSVAYTPRKSIGTLNSMGKVLVQRKTLKAQPNPALRAGDVISIRQIPYVVMSTVLHSEAGVDGGSPDQYSRIWLGALS